jgi:hypothetical protein
VQGRPQARYKDLRHFYDSLRSLSQLLGIKWTPPTARPRDGPAPSLAARLCCCVGSSELAYSTASRTSRAASSRGPLSYSLARISSALSPRGLRSQAKS